MQPRILPKTSSTQTCLLHVELHSLKTPIAIGEVSRLGDAPSAIGVVCNSVKNRNVFHFRNYRNMNPELLFPSENHSQLQTTGKTLSHPEIITLARCVHSNEQIPKCLRAHLRGEKAHASSRLEATQSRLDSYYLRRARRDLARDHYTDHAGTNLSLWRSYWNRY